MMPPYKKPALPPGENGKTVHDLLKPLKTAHALMENMFEWIEDTLPSGFSSLRPIYSIELDHMDMFDDGWSDYHHIGAQWLSCATVRPCLAAGFRLADEPRRYFGYAWDLSPLGLEKRCPFVDHKLPVEPYLLLGNAATFYNECVRDFFDNGFLIFPTKFVFDFSTLFPFDILPKNFPVYEF